MYFVCVWEDSPDFVSLQSHYLYSDNGTKCLKWCNFLPWLFLFFFLFSPSEIQRGKTLRYKSATKKTIWPEALGKNWWINLSYVWDHVWRPPIPRAGGCDPFASRPALLSTSVQDTARSGSLKRLEVFLMDSTHIHTHRHTHIHTHMCHPFSPHSFHVRNYIEQFSSTR